ncbi:ABC transporter ATP-binding protein, partial [Streptococcus pyogenes]
LLGMIPIVLMTYGTYRISQPMENMIDEARDAISELSNEVLETVEGIRVTRAYSKKANQSSRFAQKTAALAERWNAIARYR